MKCEWTIMSMLSTSTISGQTTVAVSCLGSKKTIQYNTIICNATVESEAQIKVQQINKYECLA